MEDKINTFAERQKADSICDSLEVFDFDIFYDLVYYGAVTKKEADKLNSMLGVALDNLFNKMQQFDNKNK